MKEHLHALSQRVKHFSKLYQSTNIYTFRCEWVYGREGAFKGGKYCRQRVIVIKTICNYSFSDSLLRIGKLMSPKFGAFWYLPRSWQRHKCICLKRNESSRPRKKGNDSYFSCRQKSETHLSKKNNLKPKFYNAPEK